MKTESSQDLSLANIVRTSSGSVLPISCVEAKLATSSVAASSGVTLLGDFDLYNRQPSPTAASPATGVAQQPPPLLTLAQQHSAANKPVCSHCGKVFRHNGHLNRHMYTHTGEKPHACPYCPHRNSRVDKLRHHMVAKHKDVLLAAAGAFPGRTEAGDLSQISDAYPLPPASSALPLISASSASGPEEPLDQLDTSQDRLAVDLSFNNQTETECSKNDSENNASLNIE